MLHQTPYEAWRGTKPSVAHLKFFDSIAYVLTNALHHHKFDGKSENVS